MSSATIAVRAAALAGAAWFAAPVAPAQTLPGAADAASAGGASGPTAGVAAECGAAFDPRHRRVLNGRRHLLAFAPQPAPMATGRHFGLELQVCPKAGASQPVALRLDADMPAHRHGMNYRPTLRATGEGRYRADGYLLHMPGRWRFVFDLSAEGRIERLTHEVDLP